MRFMVVGGGGMVAQRLCERMSRLGASFVVTSSSGKAGALPLDLAQPGLFDYRMLSADDVILLLAAISSPDVCRREPELCRKINIVGTEEFALRAMERGARVLFASSDTVYGETGEIVDESAPLNPVGEYGEMKAIVEDRLRSDELFLALRLSYIVAHNDKFTQYLRECARTDRVAEIFHPLNRCPVYIGDVVDTFIELGYKGLNEQVRALNVGGASLLSRIDMAKTYKETIDGTLKWRVVEPPAEFYSARPRTIHMSNERVSKLLGRETTPLQKAWCKEFEGDMLDMKK